MRLALQHISNVVVPAFYRYVQAQEPEKQREAHAAFVAALRDAHRQWFIGKGAPWARGERFGWVEAALGPWVARFALLEEHRGFKAADVGDEFAAWAQRVLERPSVRATSSLAENYESVYRCAGSSSPLSLSRSRAFDLGTGPLTLCPSRSQALLRGHGRERGGQGDAQGRVAQVARASSPSSNLSDQQVRARAQHLCRERLESESDERESRARRLDE